MASEPDQIRAQIDATREDLAVDVDRLADRTSPKRIAERRWDSVRSAVRRTSDRVMGASQDAGSSVKETAQGVAEAAREAPTMVARRTQGSPIAVGLIAFGAGLLAASLLPETDAERRAGERLADQADRVVEPLKETGRELGEDLKERAGQAASEVKDTARQAMTATKDQATESGQRAARETKEAVTS